MTYPKWKYHAVEPAVIVDSAEDEEALGRDWQDAPGLCVVPFTSTTTPTVAPSGAASTTWPMKKAKKGKA